MKFVVKNLEFQNQKTGFNNVAVLEKEEKENHSKRQKRTNSWPENGKQKLEAMMTFLFENGVSSCLEGWNPPAATTKDPAEIASFCIILSPSKSEKRLTWLIFHEQN